MSRDIDVLTELAGWIRDYCKHMSEEIAKGRQNIRSGATRLHIQQWVDTTLAFVAQSTGVPCPSCGDLIPLNLDKKVMTDIIVSLLSDSQDTATLREYLPKPTKLQNYKFYPENRSTPVALL